MKKWIINSLLDLDFYKITMAMVAFLCFRYVPVAYGFKNRTISVDLTKIIDEKELREELEHIMDLRFTAEEIDYLRESQFIKKGFFQEEFLMFLKNLKLKGLILEKKGNVYRIEVEGLWSEVIWWETLILSVVNELYTRAAMRQMDARGRKKVKREGTRRLLKKIAVLKDNPDIRFSDFGTRRRFSGAWQEYVVRKLAEKIPEQLLGTSNVFLAKKLNLPPIGTFAHEMFMIFSGIFREDIRGSHNKVLEYWWNQYGETLSVALTDTYGTDFFFRDMAEEQARKWKGLRQDSGDPFEFGEKAIRFYERFGIDPRTKIIVFSDGLDVGTIVELQRHFAGRIKVAFGWGTNLTNDLGIKALSLVVKATRSCGFGTVKLSDNLAKAMGDPSDIEMFKEIFGHTVTMNVACSY